MTPLTTILIALGLAADAFAVSISSGLIIKNLNANKALKIALSFGSFQVFMALIGWWAGQSISYFISSVNYWMAFGLLSFIGIKMIYEAIRGQEDVTAFNPLDFYTILALSVATSLDALAVGIGLALLDTSIATAVTAIGLMTFVLSFLGVVLGHLFGRLFQNKIEIIGGLILIIISSKILIEHLTSALA